MSSFHSSSRPFGARFLRSSVTSPLRDGTEWSGVDEGHDRSGVKGAWGGVRQRVNGRDNMRHEPRNDGETNVGPYGSYLRSSRCSSRVLCPSPSTPRLRLGTKGTVRSPKRQPRGEYDRRGNTQPKDPTDCYPVHAVLLSHLTRLFPPCISPLTRRFPLLLRFGDPPGGEDERRE